MIKVTETILPLPIAATPPKRATATILLSLVLTLYSCNHKPKQEKGTVSKTEPIAATTAAPPHSKSSRQGAGHWMSELSEFIPINYAVLDTTSGDVNLDGIDDYIVVLKKEGEETLSEADGKAERRPLLIVVRNKNNQLQLARRNDNAVYPIDNGGMMGDPFVGIAIKDGYFSVEHYGGSAWRWTRITTYRYSAQDQEWFLHKDVSASFHASEPEKVESTVKTTQDFGLLKFEEFDIYKE